MADEKKPKIDLKARLGKKSGGEGRKSVPPPGVIPPPAVGGGIPAPKIPGAVPTPATSGGIPVPPFAQQSGAAPKPAAEVDSGDPFGAVSNEAAPAPKPTEIKIDTSDAAVEATKSLRKFIVLAGVAGLMGGIFVGCLGGKGRSQRKQEALARRDAGEIAKELAKSNAALKKIDERIGQAVKKLKKKEFDGKLAADLRAIKLEFDGSKLEGRRTHKFGGTNVAILLKYTANVEKLKARKSALARLFQVNEKAMKTAFESGKDPKISYGVIVSQSKNGSVATLLPFFKPFSVGKEWPKELVAKNIMNRKGGKIEGVRYEAGDPREPKKKKPQVVPVDPSSLGRSFPNPLSGRILSELAKTGGLLKGAGEDEEGLIKEGAILETNLKKIAAGGLAKP